MCVILDLQRSSTIQSNSQVISVWKHSKTVGCMVEIALSTTNGAVDREHLNINIGRKYIDKALTARGHRALNAWNDASSPISLNVFH
jgi:hypothetical protein